jgi:hypothetical protein
MQKPSKAEQATTIHAFDVEETTVEVLDRSTLEAWANCPAQASLRESGAVKVMPEIAEAGELAHQVFAEVIREWLAMDGHGSPTDLRNALENQMLAARPDLQPDVIRAVKPAIWLWSQHVAGISPHNILAFDGGESDDRSGQLAFDIAGVRATCEVDLMWQGPARDELMLDDYKTGMKEWTTSDVYDSFQFQFYATAVLENWGDIQTVIVRIWNTRKYSRTGLVEFRRDDLGKFKARIAQAIWLRAMHKDNPPAWPTKERCEICDCARLCPAADSLSGPDPIALGERLVVLEAAYEATRKSLEGYVDKYGEVMLADGTIIGRNKPSAEKKKPLAIYKSKEQVDG